MQAIEINKLTKNYGRARGIADLSLQVEEGAFFGFIGPNGAGKSTTIRTLLGFIRPSAGSAAVFGRDIVRESEEIRALTGYLPSEAQFHHGMKVRDILKLSAALRGADCHAEASLLCERLQLDVTRKAEDLSFGNRKKVAIVCALQHKPKLLILDEPTSGLDPLMQHAFFEIIRERHAEGATVFLSSHILSEIEHNCTKAAIIREGTVIAHDAVSALAGKKARRVTLRGDVQAALQEELQTLPGVRDFHGLSPSAEKGRAADSMHFLFDGKTAELLQMLAASGVQDVTIAEPDLEEIFMHYYE